MWRSRGFFLRRWIAGGSYTTTFTLKPHTDAIVAVALHPCNDYIATASVDKSWSFSNIVTGRVLATILDDAVTSPLSSDDGVIRIWDIKAVR